MPKYTPESAQPTYIYVLIDPRTDEIRYVGKTIDIKRRFKNHCRCELKRDKENWVRNLRAAGLRPRMQIIETVTDGTWIQREQFWIAYYREKGCRLTNLTSGGNGSSGRRLSAASRAKISESAKSRIPSIIEARSQNWLVTSPDGVSQRIKNLRGFCREMGIDETGLLRIAQGEYRQYLGWHCLKIGDDGNPIEVDFVSTKPAAVDSQSLDWSVTSPDGVTQTIRNLNAFCREHGLHRAHMASVAQGKLRQHKGWKCRKIGDDGKPIEP